MNCIIGRHFSLRVWPWEETQAHKSCISIPLPSRYLCLSSGWTPNAEYPVTLWAQPCNQTSPQHPIMTAIWPRDVGAANTHVRHRIPFPLARNVREPQSPYLVSSPVLPSGGVDLELALIGRSLGPEMSSGSCMIWRAKEVTGVWEMCLAVNEFINVVCVQGYTCNINIIVLHHSFLLCRLNAIIWHVNWRFTTRHCVYA